MKVSRDGRIPQLELGPYVGGAKLLFQRSGIVTRLITMISAMSAFWSTNATLRGLFNGQYAVFIGAALAVMGVWMVFDYTVILPSEQNFRQGEAHTEERSPLKRDHEELKRRLEAMDDD
jgi:murein tripeptide amidase MpaA